MKSRFISNDEGCDQAAADIEYAAPVRTKDLTDIEYLQDAAPDLLEALQVLVRDCGAVDAGIELEPAIYQAQAAIAKATGGEV